MLHRNQSSNAKKCAFEPSLTHLSCSQFLFTGDSVFQAFGGIIFENLKPLWTNHGGAFGEIQVLISQIRSWQLYIVLEMSSAFSINTKISVVMLV